jgi:hypothetical protein
MKQRAEQADRKPDAKERGDLGQQLGHVR